MNRIQTITVRPTCRGLAAILIAIMLIAAVIVLRPRSIPRDAWIARQAMAAGRYQEALASANRWLERLPDSAEAHFVRARASLALGDFTTCESSYKRAILLGLPEEDQVFLRALVDVARGRHSKAEPVLARAFERNRGAGPQLSEALARIYLESFRLKPALAVLDRWASEASEDPKPYLWRAEVDRRSEGSLDAVVDDYRRALDRDPNSAQGRLGLAEALRAVHRIEEAQSEYQAYLALRPDDPLGHLGAGRNKRESGDLEAAARHLARVVELTPDNAEAIKELAELSALRGDDVAALPLFDRAARLAPFEVDIRYSRSMVLARLGRRDEAAREQEVVKRLRLEHGELNNLKSKLLTSPGDLELRAEIARWMFDHGHDTEGRRWAEAILRDRPDHPRANRLLADDLQRRGEFGLANYHRLQADYAPH